MKVVALCECDELLLLCGLNLPGEELSTLAGTKRQRSITPDLDELTNYGKEGGAGSSTQAIAAVTTGEAEESGPSKVMKMSTDDLKTRGQRSHVIVKKIIRVLQVKP